MELSCIIQQFLTAVFAQHLRCRAFARPSAAFARTGAAMGRSGQGWARRKHNKRVKQHERKEQRAASKKAELLKALKEAYPENWNSVPKTPPDPEAHRAIADVKSSMKMSRSPTPNREVKFANVLTTETRIDPYRFDEELRFSNPADW